MRVIAGIAKGRKLKSPSGVNTRPVTDQIKEAIFNIWQFQIANSRFLDLFAGSGAMGIEALSRGAAKAILVDKSPEAVKIIRENLSNCGFSNYILQKADVFRVIEQLDSQHEQFDFIYVDPPFTQPDLFLPVLQQLAAKGLLSIDGSLAIRSRKKFILPDFIGSLYKSRLAGYGESSVHFYNKRGEI